MKWFCSFKGYGDFVAACRFLRHEPKDTFRLLCARHLEGLYRAIGCPLDAEWIDISENNSFPAAYDARHQGLKAAIQSLLRIRHAIQRRNIGRDILVLEQLGTRERIMTWPIACEQVGRTTANIYESYARYFGHPPNLCANRSLSRPKTIGLFPDARLPHKVLSQDLLRSIGVECAKRHLSARIFPVGQDHDYRSAGIPVHSIDGFEELVAAIGSSDIVVSSDSLPGHLAEYFGIPVFVFVPQRKDYWMPGSALASSGFAMFSDPAALGAWLARPALAGPGEVIPNSLEPFSGRF